MANSILIAYPLNDSEKIHVLYTIERTSESHTINCCIEGGHLPVWLKLRKFSLFSLKEHGRYVPIFNEVNNSKNVDTSVFIDLVYSRIMAQEH